ncbi:mannose-1-phosphate guanylyltransferase/mannose-6-phosphate isomerase [Helicobacter sp. CLO-3]|uniref:mannose-1-phosphate guanylyltransferase/mannose-6-phosphate isomerase n=1 Tax=unclassified Helicobacter TaxID=2593540 RepID=UPI0008D9E53F|nr:MULTISPECIES: mannose-1-phosphate guanylyltransferase/mannose-6-phosphate isomerase [unclassified Helicobacter]OHU82618.1 mannose-1-phosphate guanylyltransferase/mannose-6-phosphate isomerase [Helicobacter sp. CLO-3]
MTISILCGGSGTRLFPISRELMPKQFAHILPSTQGAPLSLFQETLKRNTTLLESHAPQIQVITNESLYFIAKDQAQEIGAKIDSFILESCGKNTTPALAFAALQASKSASSDKIDGGDEIILALPSDHLIAHENYQACIDEAIKLAEQGYLVTFGIAPSSAHTGYGYIKVDSSDKHKVLGFYEKPDSKKAQEFLNAGNYYWNSGMFCFKASTMLEGLQKHCSDIYAQCVEVFEKSDNVIIDNQQCLRLDRESSENLRAESIDYALMEKVDNIACVASALKWSDVGSFESLSQEYPKDMQDNTSNTHFIAKNSKNNFILSSRPVVGVEINDLIVIDSDDCLLISKKGESAQIKEILPILRETYPELTRTHRTTYRPWGSYSVLLESKYYKIKQIVVKPKARLSLQKHFHRNEHWIIVNGSAIVRVGDQEIFLQSNQSTYIPMGQAHRLENPGKIPLVVIEVQMGEYLGEDDIVRMEDDYLRK